MATVVKYIYKCHLKNVMWYVCLLYFFKKLIGLMALQQYIEAKITKRVVALT